MPELEERLVNCFASVFPGLNESEIRQANIDSVGVWDSLAGVTLVAVIQEEFEVELGGEELAQLDSFEAFHNYLLTL